MILRIFYILLLSGGVLKTSAQTGFVTISSHGVVLAKQPDRRYYRNEIKIDLHTGDIYFRKRSSGDFKLIEKVKNDSIASFFRKQGVFEKLDSLVKNDQFRAEASFKVEYTAPGIPPASITRIFEFGRPVSDNKELNALISLYYKLREKILN